MLSQLPPRVWRGRTPGGWAGLIVGLIVGVPIAFGLGLVLAAVGVVVAVVAVVVFLLALAGEWTWYAIQRAARPPYPFPVPAPRRRRTRRTALSGLYLASAPRLTGGLARVAGWVLAPLALLIGLVGIVVPRWRARPYLAVFTLPALLRKTVALGRRRGLLRDGHDAVLLGYDDLLERRFPLLHDFLRWWDDPRGGDDYTPPPGLPDVPAGLLGLELGPSPDPLGTPGLAAGAMRRRSVHTLRDLLLSQREIDDLCDPDLDERIDTAVIRLVVREHEGVRHWIVQFPSTKSWHPRPGIAPNDLTADLVIGAEHEATITRAAIETMREAGIREGEPVVLAGFSLGGMVAAQVAVRARAAGFTVTHLVVAGTPLGRLAVPDGVRTLAIEHVLDLVPRIDGRENAVRLDLDGPQVLVTVKAGPPLAPGFRLGALHQAVAYADTAGVIETDPPGAPVAVLLGELRPFFGEGQRVHDRAALRAGSLPARAAVPLYLHSTVEEGITRGSLRQSLRRLAGVYAVDVYQSRGGLATTILWSADVLVRALEPWLAPTRRAAIYRGLLSLLGRRRGVGIHLRLQARTTPGLTWEATLQRMPDGRWRETIDVIVDDRAAAADIARLFPEGVRTRVVLHRPDAFEPVVDVAGV
ncbi:thioesterase domain-containing protein [Leifsonia shinshuensis]|uniref:Thioesterase domain-containing protein n=1 Tax=Leifsonia shinshuensis TaxID=150026 RepID=A0A853CYA2_9MICO|nr:thioesterase domain-containing protein [Leifsonia shinshuensis]NYJ25518.1 hypothetical protein [Leifsonia shinshuensis]